jgi:NAD(P)-dependent dehydrogenase (short-subunit alcohol dehydrogenase family)
MKDKIVLISGSNSGIGKATAIALAKSGAQIVMQCRSLERGEVARLEIIKESGNSNVDLMLCDLSSHDSIRKFNEEFRQKYQHIDVLINNAGGIFGKKEMTSDNLEYTIGLNHMGYFLNTHYLLDLLKAGEMKRIVNVSSLAHKFVMRLDWDNLQGEKSYGQLYQYGLSKLFNIHFTKELARRYQADGITVNCLHPGTVNTGFGNSGSSFFKKLVELGRRFLTPADKGAATSVFLASAPEVKNISGEYFSNKKIASISKIAKSDEYARKIWDKSLEWSKIEEFGVK